MVTKAKVICELCGENSDMDFNCIIPRGNKSYFLKGNICFNCYGNVSSDYILAIKIIKKRDDVEPGYKQKFLEENEIKEDF